VGACRFIGGASEDGRPGCQLLDRLIDDVVTETRQGTTVAGAGEAATLLGVSLQRMHVLRGRADFPATHQLLSVGPVWLVEDVQRYDETRNKRPGPRGRRDDRGK
jgi:hypothetical protein